MKNRPKTILIEALALSNDSGLGGVTRLYLRSLIQIFTHENVILLTRQSYSDPLPLNWTNKVVLARPFRWWKKVLFPLFLFKTRPTKTICLGQTLPFLKPKGEYHLLIPDVGPLENLGFNTSRYDSANRKILKQMILRADVLWTISEFTQSRLKKIFPSSSLSIKVIKPIFKPSPSFQTETPPLLKEFNRTNTRYILSLGNIEPKKNFPLLIKAFDALMATTEENLKLVIIGHKAWGYPEVENVLKQCRFPEKIHCLGFITEGEKWHWLKNCHLYASTSIYEGWGFPLFEALFLGKPCLYQTGTSHSEFAKGFGVEMMTTDVQKLAEKIKELCFSPQKRTQLIEHLSKNFNNTFDYNITEQLKEAVSG